VSLADKILVRGGTTAQWDAANPVLDNREIGYDSTTKQIKIGDSTTPWNDLAYSTPVVSSVAFSPQSLTAAQKQQALDNIGSGIYRLNQTDFLGSISFGNGLRNSTRTTGDTGRYNFSAGIDALTALTTGYYTTAVGANALKSTTTSYGNTAIGFDNMPACTTGFDNTGVGASTLFALTTGIDNCAFGVHSLQRVTTSNENAGYGTSSLQYVLTGSRNTAIGTMAGRFLNDEITWLETNTECTYVGYLSKGSIDGRTNETVIGARAIGLGSNTTTIGSTSVTQTVIYGNLGLGTVAPTANIHIDSATTTSTTVGAKNARIILGNNTLTANAGADVVLGCIADTSTGRYAAIGTDIEGSSGGGASGGVYIATKASTSDTSLTRRFFVTSGGRVGIGTNVPSSLVQVAGDMASNPTTGGYAQFEVSGASFPTQRMCMGYNTSGSYGVLQALVNGSSWSDIAINPEGGNVGIGKISPAVKLDVAGAVYQVVTGSAITLSVNNQLAIEMISNTDGRIVYRGSDGITRRFAFAVS
jgi:hypothetical protein